MPLVKMTKGWNASTVGVFVRIYLALLTARVVRGVQILDPPCGGRFVLYKGRDAVCYEILKPAGHRVQIAKLRRSLTAHQAMGRFNGNRQRELSAECFAERIRVLQPFAERRNIFGCGVRAYG